MSLDPLNTTEAIKENYLSYLYTAFKLKNPDLQKKFEEKLKSATFFKGPILEATPPFKTTISLKKLVNNGLLSKEFVHLKSEVLPLDRPLWQHQEIAIKKVIRDSENVVVATGTGSGKTEAFLVPILNHLFRQKEEGHLDPGVRALLLYPMNALANDQLKRMRKLLTNYPEITFGRYTGETEEFEKAAKDKYLKMNKEEPLENELISRKQMKNTPPNILLTNYAMLDYLLLRPKDHVFFDGDHAKDWKFVVIDEAHTYNGAKGIEMAMLLRRLKDRVVKSEPNKLRCIATSATLGRGGKDFGQVADFAEKLFGESFEPENVIQATCKSMERLNKEWGVPNDSLYKKWQTDITEESGEDTISSLTNVGVNHGIPLKVLENSKQESDGDTKRFLYHTLKGDRRVATLKKHLRKGPHFLDDLDLNISKDNLIALVELAVKAKPGEEKQPLLPGRYHLFVRAIEGAYLSLLPQKSIYLERREYVRKDGQQYPVFEISTCQQCGATYLVGETGSPNSELPTSQGENKVILKQPGRKYYEDPNKLEYYLLLDETTEILPENEDELVNLEKDYDLLEERYKICGKCGTIDKANLITPLCNCDSGNYFDLLKVKSKEGKVHKCPACGRTNPKGSLVWRFLLGKDAISSVLGTSLYQQLPTKVNKPRHTASTDTQYSGNLSPHKIDGNRNQRKLLIFSDSRQNAAYFATYFNRTYSQILRRRVILQTIQKNKTKIIQNKWRVQDLVKPLKRQIEQFNLLLERPSPQQHENEAWKWLFHELLGIDTRIGLEGLGCLGFSLAKPKGWKAPPELLNPPWNLSGEEVWIMFQILLDSFKREGAIAFPDNISPKDPFFKPRNREYYFREEGSSRKRHIKSWIPSKASASNSRLDYIERLASKMGMNPSENNFNTLLKKIWIENLDLDNTSSPWRDYFSSISLSGEGVVYKMKYDFWKLQPTLINQDIQWYYCDKCNTLTLHNLKGVCPTYRCEGDLKKCNPGEIFKKNHYRNLYLGVLPLRMKAAEHTAQLTPEAAAELQTEFINGQINALSCSTTFELGVDVGELESVFMRNVPPFAANYIQRAGRAGRRTDSTAFALTFCQRRSHDLAHFFKPFRMVNGKIEPPHFEIKNEKIIRRHMYATALAKFWKENPQTFKDVESFFFRGEKNGVTLFKNYLDGKPEAVYESLKRIVPQQLERRLRIDTWEWVSGLYDQEEGELIKVQEEVQNDVAELESVRESLKERNKLRKAAVIHKTIKTIKKPPLGYLINVLSRRNIIPKYGFPVDVVELQILHHSGEARRLELNRDLRIALSEYAPSSQVVAGGKLWTSRYLKKLPEREWPKYRYAICSYCGRYQRVPEDSPQRLDTCKACERPLEGRNQGRFLKPEFGFVASIKPPAKPGEEQPEKTYTTRTYYSGECDEKSKLEIDLQRAGTLRLIPASHGKMAVINHAGYQGFKICHSCGYAVLGSEGTSPTHKTPWGKKCSGKLYSGYALGHEYMTDILQVQFEEYANDDSGFWFSLLYALLEGGAEALDIDRGDLDGCLYPYANDPSRRALILFDNVPGGAGHVQRIAKSEAIVRKVFRSAHQRMIECECGGTEGHSSCYGCLRNYQNQFCHNRLDRRQVIDFLDQYIFQKSYSR